MMPPIRVAILSHTRLLADGVAAILAPEKDILVERWSPDTPRAAARRPPDILLADGRMEGALDLCAELQRRGSRPRTIVLAAAHDCGWGQKALENGARGVVARDSGARELVKAIRVVHQGQVWAGSDVIARSLDELTTLFGALRANEACLGRLSAREREVARHAAGGLANREIAQRLGISQATVKAHLTRIFQKLGLRGRGRLAAVYYREGR